MCEVFNIKNKSKFLTFFILVIFILSISAVSADDSLNGTVVNDEIGENIQLEEQYVDDSITESTNQSNIDDELINLSECSSIILQVSNTEGVLSVRRDAENPADLSIVNDTWGSIDIVKQYKTTDGYFVHAIVTSNGWLIGNGGVTDGSRIRQIESIASEMVLNNVISNDYLSRIYNIFAGDELGHFVIKAPDGTYGVVFVGHYYISKLNPGEYFVCPNVESKSHTGTYDQSLSPVDASIKLGYTDDYGVNRRNLMTYHWKLAVSQNALSFDVDCYGSNDNGAGVGLSTAGLSDNVNCFGLYYSKSSLPLTPNKLYLGTHTFEKTNITIFNLVSPVKTALVGEYVNVPFQVNYMPNNNPVVQFAIPQGFSFSGATLSKGTCHYDSNSRILFWNLNDCELNNYITLTLKAVKSGAHELVFSLNDAFINSINLYANDYGAVIYANNLGKYCRGPEKLNVYLNDVSNNPIVGENLKISINGMEYTRSTDENGLMSMAINLNPGDYQVTISYNGKFGSNSTNVKVRILSTISANDIVKIFRNSTQFYANFISTSGNPLSNTNVSFNINGVFYTRSTDNYGIAKLNINLYPGDYILTAINSDNNEEYGYSVKVLPSLVDNHDLTKYYKNDSVYSIKALDDTGKPLAGVNVTFNINGVFYQRTTNESGYANLNIRLSPNKYIITSYFNGLECSNFVTVLPVLSANDTTSYNGVSNFSAKLVDGVGNPYSNQTITFNINGVIYTNMTDENGIAKLFVNLPKGEYIVTSSYDGCYISNRITIKNGV